MTRNACLHDPAPYQTKTGTLLLAKDLLGGLLLHRTENGKKIQLPCSAVAGYPHKSRKWGDERELEMETLARSFLLAACILANEPDCRLGGVRIRDFYMDWLLGMAKDPFFLPRHDCYDQATVEMASICIGLAESGIFWTASSAEREVLLVWIKHFRHSLTMNNNWKWFSLIINAFLRIHGKMTFADDILNNLSLLDKMYVGAGWYRDGVRGCFDYYAAWSFQLYPLILSRWGCWGVRAASVFARRNDLFLQSYSHLFSAEGHMPCWGRSICYRFAASAPFSMAFMRDNVEFDAGFARHICIGNLMQFMNKSWLKSGVPSLGFYQENAAFIDPYSCVASPMWCFKYFFCLLLDEKNLFWQSSDSTGWWGKVDRYDIQGTGMHVLHDDFNSTLFAPQRKNGDPRYERSYYSTNEVVNDK